MVRVSLARFSNQLLRAPPVRGANPSKQNRSLGRPESSSAVVTALGPGKTLIFIFFSTAARAHR